MAATHSLLKSKYLASIIMLKELKYTLYQVIYTSYPKIVYLIFTSEFFTKSKWELKSNLYAKMCQIYVNGFL